MFTVWNTPTYSHSYLIPLASIWMAIRKKDELKALSAFPFWWMLVPLGAASAVWLVGHVAGVNTLEHSAIIGSTALIAAYVFGRDIAARLLFPLGFLLLAIPFGDFMVPYMMTWTANITVAMVQASGVPIFRDGLSFVLPSGSWQVVEECSGQRYLIALVPLALIFGELTFTRFRTKVLFVLSSLVVAVVANWIRAYLIVMTGHLSGMTLATGVDHLIYGWFFFGIIVALLFMWGARWKEAPNAANEALSTSSSNTYRTRSYPLVPVVVSGWLVIVSGYATAEFLATRSTESVALSDRFESLAVTTDSEIKTSFIVPFKGASEELQMSLDHGKVDAWLATFKNTSSGSEMVTGKHSIVQANRKLWRHSSTRSVEIGEPKAGVGNEFRFIGTGSDLLVWQTYLVNGRFEKSEREAKIQLAIQQLSGRGSESTVILLWTTYRADLKDAQARLSKSANLLSSRFRQEDRIE